MITPTVHHPKLKFFYEKEQLSLSLPGYRDRWIFRLEIFGPAIMHPRSAVSQWWHGDAKNNLRI
jgi:hypothetical protein